LDIKWFPLLTAFDKGVYCILDIMENDGILPGTALANTGPHRCFFRGGKHMKVFRDIEINLGAVEPADLATSIEKRLTGGWHRDKDGEARKDATGTFFYFQCPEKGDRKEARISVVGKSESVFHVANIGPLKSGRFSVDQFNAILEEFNHSFLAPACDELGVRTKMTPGVQQIEDWISPGSAQRLRAFSSHANRDVPHPSDERLWHEFLLHVHQEHSKLHVDTLERWLIEDEHWPEDRADELALEYEFAMGLLDYQSERERQRCQS
jgi:hypothetical protein